MRIEDTVFAFIDTETNGSKPTVARPVQVAVLLAKNGQILAEKSWLINPEARIPPDAAGFHQITNAMVAEAPTLATVKDEILKIIGDAVPVSYKAQFHKAMLPFIDREWICCHRLARHVLPHGEVNAKGHALESHDDQYLRYWLDLKVETGESPCHNAPADVKTFVGIFKAATERFLDYGYVNDTGALIAFANRPAPLARISLGIYRDTPLQEVETSWLRTQAFRINKGEMSLEPDLEYTIMSEYDRRCSRKPAPAHP